MDLTTYPDPFLNYARWFYCFYGAVPDDTLQIIISNGITSTVVDEIGSDPAQFYLWTPKSLRILDFIALTNSMQVSFRTSDLDPDVNITEAGVDYFYISNSTVLGIENSDKPKINVFPNPFENWLVIEGAEIGSKYEVFNLQGQKVHGGEIDVISKKINTQNIPSGMLFVKINNDVYKVMKE